MDKKSNLDLNSIQQTTTQDPIVQDDSALDPLSVSAHNQKDQNVPIPPKSFEERIQDALALNALPNLGVFKDDNTAKEDVTKLIEAQAATIKGWNITGAASKKVSTFLVFLKQSGDMAKAWAVLAGVNKHAATPAPSLSEPSDLTLNEAFVTTWESANPQKPSLKAEFEALRKLLVKNNEVKQADWAKALDVLTALADANQNVAMNIGAGILPQWIAMHQTYGPGKGAPKGVPFHKGARNLETHVEKHLLHQHGNPDPAEPPQWMQALPFDVLRSDIEGIQDKLKIEGGDLDTLFPNSATKLDPSDKASTTFFFGTFIQRPENAALVTALRIKYQGAYEKKASDLLEGATKPFVIDGGGKAQIIGPSAPFITFARIQKDLSLSIMSAYIPTDLNGTVSGEASKKVWDL